MSSTLTSSSIQSHRSNKSISQQLQSIFTKLSQNELESLYWRGARLWIYSFDHEIRITFGSPDDHSARRIMENAPSLGHWVSIGISRMTSDEHPVDADGNLYEKWIGASTFASDQLLQCVDEIASDLELKVESFIEQLSMVHLDLQTHPSAP